MRRTPSKQQRTFLDVSYEEEELLSLLLRFALSLLFFASKAAAATE